MKFSDVLSVLDEDQCELRMRLASEGLKSFEQYYTVRYKYCASKFGEKYGNAAPTFTGTVPRSIDEFWQKCDANLQKVVEKFNITFVHTSTKVNDVDVGDVFIDATGTLNGNPAIFKMIFGGSWRKKFAVELVKYLDYTTIAESLAPPETNSITLAAIILGSEKDDPDDMVRFVPREGVKDKKGTTYKEKTWDMMRAEFDEAVKKTKEIIERNLGRELSSINANPVPGNCGFCQFHNVVLDVNGDRKACSGFYHDA